jgi:hypothetical protein
MIRPQVLQDTMEDTEGEEDAETGHDSDFIDAYEAEDRTYEEDEYIAEDPNNEDDEFMTPPSSPENNVNISPGARSQDEISANTAPLNPLYKENTGSAGATKN